MARRRKYSARSTSTTPSVNEIKERWDKDNERTQINFTQAIEGLKTIADATSTAPRSITAYGRETLRGYLQNPSSNEANLIKAGRYYYYRSQIIYRLVNWYASMWCLECRKVIPNYDLTNPNSLKDALKNYNATLDQLDIYNIKNNFYNVACNCYIEDVCYSIFFRDNTGAFFYILDPTFCKITTKYMTGDLGFAVDMSKYRSAYNQKLIEWLGEPLSSMWKAYQSTGEKWQQMPDEYAACFKFNSSELNLIMPPFVPLLQEIAGLNDLADIQAIADEQSIYKLLVLPMKVLSGAKQSDDFEVSPKLLLKYFDRLVDEALPDYVSAAPVPGDGLEVIDFSDSAADKDVDRYEQSQNTILATSGGGAVLNASNITSTAAFKAWLQAETQFATASLMPQIEGFTNRMLMNDLKNPCKVEYFRVSIYTKEDMAEKLLESCQYSFNNKLFYNTFLGVSEKTTVTMAHFEEEILGLHELMKYPLSSSYTSTTNVNDEGGREPKDDDELSPSGERSRNQ